VPWWRNNPICPNDREWVRIKIVRHFHPKFMPEKDDHLDPAWLAVPHDLENGLNEEPLLEVINEPPFRHPLVINNLIVDELDQHRGPRFGYDPA